MALHQLVPSFSCPCKKTEAITPRRDRLQTPVSRLTLRVVDTAGARGNSPAFDLATADSNPPAASLRRTGSRRVFFARRRDARRGTKGNLKTKDKTSFLKPLSKRLPDAYRYAGGDSLPPQEKSYSADEFRRLDEDRRPAWVLTIREVTLLNVSIELGEGQDVMSCPRRKELEWNPLTAIEGS